MDYDKNDYVDDFTKYVMSTFKKDTTSIDIRPQILKRLSHYEYFRRLKKKCNDDLVITGVLDLINFPNLKEINCSGNEITAIINIPHIKSLTCSSNKILQLDYLPDTLEYLDCSNNNIVNLDNLPVNLKHLNCTNCNIVNLNSFPNNLKILKCQNTLNNNIYYLPSKLEMLKCNDIYQLKNIPDSLSEIYIYIDTKVYSHTDIDIQFNCEKTHKFFYENSKKIKNGYYRKIKNFS